MEDFWLNVKAWAKTIVQIVVEIFMRIISFANDVVKWFKEKIKGVRSKKAIILAKMKLDEILGKGKVGQMLDIENAKVVDGLGIYENDVHGEVIYDSETQKVDELRIVASSGVDEQFKSIMKENPVVVLA